MGKNKHTKHLCDWDKDDLPRRIEELKRKVRPPTHACRKCMRVAADERWLCKPTPLD